MFVTVLRSCTPVPALLPAVAAAAVVVAAGGALAQPSASAAAKASMAVATIVKVPKPLSAPRSAVASRMRETIPQYDALPGLAFKAYSFAEPDGQYGGLYLWKDAASARNWFNAAWFESVEKERNVKADVRFFDVPVAIDNTPGGTPLATDSAGVGTLVQITIPAGVTRERLIAGIEAAVPAYRQVPGLLRKSFIISADGRFGGIYLWQDQASAERWFSDDWKARTRKTYGSDAAIEWFATPILLPSRLAENRLAATGGAR